MTFARAMPGEYRGMYSKPAPEIAKRDDNATVITAEAMAVAREYVMYRLHEGWEARMILKDLGIPDWAFYPSCQAIIRMVAEHWQDEIAPASRAVDAERKRRVLPALLTPTGSRATKLARKVRQSA